MLTAPRENIINNALKERNKRGYFKTLIGRLHVVVSGSFPFGSFP